MWPATMSTPTTMSSAASSGAHGPENRSYALSFFCVRLFCRTQRWAVCFFVVVARRFSGSDLRARISEEMATVGALLFDSDTNTVITMTHDVTIE